MIKHERDRWLGEGENHEREVGESDVHLDDGGE